MSGWVDDDGAGEEIRALLVCLWKRALDEWQRPAVTAEGTYVQRRAHWLDHYTQAILEVLPEPPEGDWSYGLRVETGDGRL
jgi:hypothetical protein